MHDLKAYLVFLRTYTIERILNVGTAIEQVKDVIVAFLIVKRGKYSNSFLNTTFFILVAIVLIGGPIIAENNPFLQASEDDPTQYQAADVSYNPYEGSLSTVLSQKPRDKVLEYAVASGDTLDSIAKKFDISVETIKWANNLKSNTIKPGQTLKILPISGVAHKVVSGDNIYAIAKKYKTDAQKIVNFPFNDFTDLDTFTLAIGQTLFVPDGVIEEAKPRVVAPQYAQAQAGVKGSTNFVWPTTGGISQYPIWYHMALDIANRAAPPVIASDTGTVIFSGCVKYGYGCHVIIDHGNGFKSLYAHLSRIDVSAGQAVSQSTQLGIMGSTGRSTGTHLHFEIRSADKLQNPLNYLR